MPSGTLQTERKLRLVQQRRSGLLLLVNQWCTDPEQLPAYAFARKVAFRGMELFGRMSRKWHRHPVQ